MEAQHKRVEQKGRFTITEIVPVSSFSAQCSSSPFQDFESSTKASGGTRVATLSPCQANVHDACITTTTVRTKDLKRDELFECSQTQEAETVVMVPVESTRTLASEVRSSLCCCCCSSSSTCISIVHRFAASLHEQCEFFLT